jgi:hypothetical protein
VDAFCAGGRIHGRKRRIVKMGVRRAARNRAASPRPDESKKRSARRFAASQDQPPFVTTGDEPCILVMAARVVAIHGGLTPIVARPIAGDRPDGESTP